ncbi:MAG: 3-hydroxybenzoate 6-hydroxylase, partial [Arthrobacter sp.]
QGACQALEDAAVLQDAASNRVFTAEGIDAGAWEDAFREFNETRAARTARVQRTARIWGESWHVDGVARVLRNMLFKSRGDNNFQYNDWLYGRNEPGAPAEVPAGAKLVEA